MSGLMLEHLEKLTIDEIQELSDQTAKYKKEEAKRMVSSAKP